MMPRIVAAPRLRQRFDDDIVNPIPAKRPQAMSRSILTMLAILTGLTAIATPDAKAGERHLLGDIEVNTDAGYRLVLGGTDSVMGTLTRQRDGFAIRFDIGAMAGTHVQPGMRAQCTRYREFEVAHRRAASCLRANGTIRRIDVTIGGEDRLPSWPANFYADLRSEAELAEFERVIGSVRVAPHGR